MHLFRLLALPATSVALLSPAYGQTSWWNGSQGPESGGSDPGDRSDAYRWNDNANWSADATNTTPGTAPATNENAVFNVDGDNSDYIIHLNNNSREVNHVTFDSTGNILFVRDNNPPSAGADYMEVGSSLTLNTNSGAVTFGDSSDTDYQLVGLEALSTSLTITNESSNVLTFNGIVRADSGVNAPTTISVLGGGSGGIVFNNGIDDSIAGGTAVVSVVIATAPNTVTTLGTNGNYSGGTTLDEGIVVVGHDNSFGTGTLTINGGRLGVASNGINLGNDIVVGGDFAIGTESSISGSSAGFSNISSNIDLGGATREITIRRTTNLSGVISNGGLTFIGVGSGDSPDSGRELALTGVNTYTGATTISSGTLVLGASASIATSSEIILDANTTLDVTAQAGAFSVASGQTIRGVGTVAGAITIDGSLAPGASIGTITLTDNLTLTGTSDFEIDASAVTSDLAIAQAIVTFGGTLNVTNLAGTLAAGHSFDLFDFDNSQSSGTFTSVNLPTLTGGLTWDESQLYTQGVIAVIPEPSTALLAVLGSVGMMLRRRS